MTSALLADDAPLIREAIAAVLGEAGIDVLGQVGDVSALYPAVQRLRPDIVIVDIRMPPTFRQEGLDAAVRLRAADASLGLLVLSQHVEAHHLRRLVASGAAYTGYLLKERAAGIDSFIGAVRTVAAGGCCFDPQVVSAMVASSGSVTKVDSLSPREREVLQAMAEGASNVAICRRLRLGEKTVEAHIRRIFQRLDIPDEPDVNRRVKAVLAFLAAEPR